MPSKLTHKLTKTLVDNLLPEPADYTVHDKEIPGFHVRVRSSGIKSWGLRYRLKCGKQGRLNIGRVEIITADQARKKALKVKAEIQLGLFRIASETHIEPAFTLKDSWAEYLKLHAEPLKATSSIKQDGILWKNHINPYFKNILICDISSADVMTFLADKKDIKVTGNRAVALLSKIFSVAIANKRVLTNPCIGVKRYDEFGRETFLTEEQIEQLFTAADEDKDQGAATIVKLAVSTGARLGELLAMRWEDVHNGVWRLAAARTKQRTANSKPLGLGALEILREWNLTSGSPKSGLVFPRSGTVTTQRKSIKSQWKRMRSRATLSRDVLFHDMRHTFCAQAVMSGVSLADIGAYMGHTNTKTTQKYAHFAPGHLRAVASSFPTFTKSLGARPQAAMMPSHKHERTESTVTDEPTQFSTGTVGPMKTFAGLH